MIFFGGCSSPPSTPSSDIGSRSSTSEIYETRGDRRFDAGFQKRPFVDRSRNTPATDGEGEKTHRRLETTFFYPIRKGENGLADPNLIPHQEGPFPMVIFSHGLGAPVTGYQGLLLELASVGYVVAAPKFPVSGVRGDASASDARNQPGDISFLLNEIERLAQAGDELAGFASTSRVVVGGHSFGVGTVFGSRLSSCCRDQRVAGGFAFGTAQSALSGLGEFPEDFPLLLVQGTEDDLPTAINVYEAAKPPKVLLMLEGAEHIQPFMYMSSPPEPAEELTAEVSILFLDAVLKGRADGFSSIGALVGQNRSLGSLRAET